MRSCERRLPVPGWPVGPGLALFLAGLGLVVWLVGGLVLVVICLVPRALALALALPVALVLLPVAPACRSWLGWHWLWPGRPGWFLWLGSWLCGAWLRWPWLCWSWLR